MIKMLIDTCVWLDLAKNPKEENVLSVIEGLLDFKELQLIVPRIIIEEFNRNKVHVISEYAASVTNQIKQTKRFLNKHGDKKKKMIAIDQLDDLENKMKSLDESAIDVITRIDKVLNNSKIIEETNEIKLRAADRARHRKAPFHQGKSSFPDAIIIETYAEVIREKKNSGIRYAFVTHNKNDFSYPRGNEKMPHPDIASLFSRVKSLYFIHLPEAIGRFKPQLITDLMIQQEDWNSARIQSEIGNAINELWDKIWYNRHQNWLYRIEIGEDKIVKNPSLHGGYNPHETSKAIYDLARKGALRIEKKYGLRNLGPWDDFEWGMLSGKLSALRWVLGDDWDNLDT